MTFLQNLRRGLAEKLAPELFGATLRDIEFSTAQQRGRQPDTSHESLVKKYTGWVYSCAQLSATRLAATPLKLYATRATGEGRVKNFPTRQLARKESTELLKRSSLQSLATVKAAEDAEEITEHPLLELLRNVNDFHNMFETLETTSIFLDVTGNAYWYLPESPLGLPTELWILPSQHVRILPDKEKFIRGYLYGTSSANQIKIEPEAVIHFKYTSLTDPYYGVGPVQAGAFSIQRQDAMDKYEDSMLNNMGRPDFVVNYPQANPNDRKARRELEREWNNAYGGPNKAGKVHISMGSKADISTIGFSPRDLQFQTGRPWTLKEIAALFPVPLGLVDTQQISSAPRAGIEGSDLLMAKLNTWPRIQRIEQKLNESLTPRFDKRLFLAFDNPVPEDREYALRRTDTYVRDWILTINEARAAEGLETMPWGNVPLVPFGVFPLGKSPPTIEPEAGKFAGNPAEKPFANEHAARLRDPDAFVRIVQLWARESIRALGGPLKSDPRGGAEIQSLRFDRQRWTAAEARRWLNEHDFKPIEFEPATGGGEERQYIDGKLIHRDLRGLKLAIGN